MSDEVFLRNLTPRTHVIVLSHAAFRDKRWGFRVERADAVDTDRNGNATSRQVRRALCGSLTLLPGARIDGLHPAIRNEPQVVTLLAQRAVEIGACEDAEPPKAADPKATKPESKPEPKASRPEPPPDPHETMGRVRVQKKSEG